MVVIRAAHRGDLDALLGLCVEHARHERAAAPGPSAAAGLATALWDEPPRAWCLVADDGGALVGYASYSREFSTWKGGDYLHLDCLYVQQAHRGKGLGALLLRHVAGAAVESGLDEVQWQTPAWNTDAARFYRRNGATGAEKLRFTLRPQQMTSTSGGAP